MKLKKFKQTFAALCCVMTVTISLAISIAAQHIATAPNDKTATEIEKAVRELYDAFIRRDAAGFNNALADGGFLYDNYGFVSATDFKNEIAGYFKAPAPANTKFSYEISNLKIFAPAEGAAIANYEIVRRTEENGKMRSTRERHTNVLVRGADGRWRIFAEHNSELPKAIEPTAPGMPTGWSRTPLGDGADYWLTVDESVKHGGKASARVAARCADKDKNWASLGQAFAADGFRGKRLRLTGWLKTENADSAGLWMRVDGKHSQMGFDNMTNRAVTGTSDWKQYSVVLDVPNEAVNIVFGTLVQGAGSVWIDDLKLETVGADVAATNMMTPEQMKQENPNRDTKPAANKQAINLDFEMGAVAKTN